MPFQTWIADALREANLPVHEVADWKVRGDSSFEPRGVIVHHTASREVSYTAAPSLNVCIFGRRAAAGYLPGPLCNVLISRAGTCYVVAAGQANHAGTGNFRGIINGNRFFFGIEAENDGVGEPWSAELRRVFATATAALLRGVRADHHWCIGHKEWAPRRKIDPNFDMSVFRVQVHQQMLPPGSTSPPTSSLDQPPLPPLSHLFLEDAMQTDLVSLEPKSDGWWAGWRDYGRPVHPVAAVFNGPSLYNEDAWGFLRDAGAIGVNVRGNEVHLSCWLPHAIPGAPWAPQVHLTVS